jgi:hypothetical protein
MGNVLALGGENLRGLIVDSVPNRARGVLIDHVDGIVVFQAVIGQVLQGFLDSVGLLPSLAFGEYRRRQARSP